MSVFSLGEAVYVSNTKGDVLSMWKKEEWKEKTFMRKVNKILNRDSLTLPNKDITEKK